MKVRNIATSMVAGIATLASASVLAFDFDGFYVLGGVGVAGVDNMKFAEIDDFGTAVKGPDLEARADFAWRGGIGLWLTDNIGLEANYIGMSDHDETMQEGFDVYHLEVSGLNYWDLTGIGRCFIADDFWVFGRAGMAYADKTVNLNETFIDEPGVLDNEVHDDNGGLGASFGVGAQWDFADWAGIRLELSTIQALNENDMYAFTGNLVINIPELM